MFPQLNELIAAVTKLGASVNTLSALIKENTLTMKDFQVTLQHISRRTREEESKNG